MLDPNHARTVLAHKDGKLKMITYWCDVCSIRSYEPGPCWCCQAETVLDLRDPGRAMKFAALLLLLPLMSTAANYSAQNASDHGIETVRLTDAAHKTEVSIAPSFGNMAYEMKVNGKNISVSASRQHWRIEGQAGAGRCPVAMAVGQPYRPGRVLGQRQEIPAQPGARQFPLRRQS